MSEITCPSCQRVNPVDYLFCTGCGLSLSDAGAPTRENPAGDQEQQAFQAELTSVQSQIRQAVLLIEGLQDRISRLESGSIAPAQANPPAPVSPPPSPAPTHHIEQEPSPQAAAPVTPFAATPSGSAPSLSPVAPAAPGAGGVPQTGSGGSIFDDLLPPGVSIDWEQVLGRNWFAIIGAVALVLGIGFFLKLAFDNNWIGDTGRVALGIGLGLALLGVGEYTSRRVPIWSQPVTAGGAAILYLAIYASFGLYQLLRPDVAFLFLALVVALAGLLALRYESIVIAVLGIIGAFLAPVLLGPSLPDVRLVLVYIIVVDIGILAVSTFRNWRWFTLLGWVGSYGLFAYWLTEFSDYEPLLIQGALTAVFLVFAGATTLFHLLWKRVPGPLDMGLVGINATGFFALTVAILWEDYQIWFGLIALALALFYGLTASAAIKRSGAPPEVAMIALPVALVFLTVAVPLQLSGVWVTVAWAAQGAVLVWAGFLLARWPMRAFGLGVLTLAVGRLFLFEASLDPEDFTLVLNERFPVFLAVIAACYVAGFLHWRNRSQAEQWERHAAPALFGVANLLTLALLSMEVISYFDYRSKWALEHLDSRTAENGKHLALTVIFAVYAFILTSVGLGRRLQLARWTGLGLMAVASVKLLAFDTLFVRLAPQTFVAFLNFQFLAFVLVMAALSGMAFWFWRERSRLPGWEAYAFQGLLVAVNIVAVWALSQEIVHYFGSREVVLQRDYFSATQLSLTVLWAVYATGVIGAGIALRSSRIRLAGMALLAVPVAKLFVFDVFLLERGYRVAAFVTLGVLLLGTGLVYQRYSLAIRGFLFGRQT